MKIESAVCCPGKRAGGSPRYTICLNYGITASDRRESRRRPSREENDYVTQCVGCLAFACRVKDQSIGATIRTECHSEGYSRNCPLDTVLDTLLRARSYILQQLKVQIYESVKGAQFYYKCQKMKI